jgi:hypothetical protein
MGRWVMTVESPATKVAALFAACLLIALGVVYARQARSAFRRYRSATDDAPRKARYLMIGWGQLAAGKVLLAASLVLIAFGAPRLWWLTTLWLMVACLLSAPVSFLLSKRPP